MTVNQLILIVCGVLIACIIFVAAPGVFKALIGKDNAVWPSDKDRRR